MKTKFRHLDEALAYLHDNGKESDFTNDGLPTVRAVKRIYDGLPTRKSIDRGWQNLYGFSTYREKK